MDRGGGGGGGGGVKEIMNGLKEKGQDQLMNYLYIKEYGYRANI